MISPYPLEVINKSVTISSMLAENRILMVRRFIVRDKASSRINSLFVVGYLYPRSCGSETI